jgi:hypothetical protein
VNAAGEGKAIGGEALRKALPVALPVLVLALGALAFVGLSSLQPARKQATVQERQAPPVRVAPLVQRTVTLDVIGHGSARARDTYQLGSEVAGRIAFVSSNLRVGSFVGKDEVLLRLDDREQRLARRSAQAEVARARSALDRLVASTPHLEREVELRRERVELAKAEYDRQVGLKSSGVASLNLIDQARSLFVQEQAALQAAERALNLLPHDVAQARAALEASQAALGRADYALERLVLRAPVPAQVSARQADVGQVVAPGTPLIALNAHDVYEVPVRLANADLVKLALIPADAIPRGVTPPPGFTGRSPATVTWKAQGASYEAVLARIESVDADTRTVPAVVEVHQPWASLERGATPLLPGAYCQVRLQGKTRPGAWVVPERALREGDRLYLLRGGRLTIVGVSVDHLMGGEAVITPAEPPQPGDQLILSPITYPVTGMALRVEAGS